MLVHIQFRQENSEKITNLWTLRTIMEFLKCDKTRYYKRHHQSKLHERRILKQAHFSEFSHPIARE